MMTGPVQPLCCVCQQRACWGYYIPEDRDRGTWWGCDEHRATAEAYRDAARGTTPKAPAVVADRQGSLFGGTR